MKYLLDTVTIVRLILATAKWLEIPILSSDKRFLNIDSISVIWN